MQPDRISLSSSTSSYKNSACNINVDLLICFYGLFQRLPRRVEQDCRSYAGPDQIIHMTQLNVHYRDKVRPVPGAQSNVV